MVSPSKQTPNFNREVGRGRPSKIDIFANIHPGGYPMDYQLDWVNDRHKYKLGVKARQIGITTSEATMNFVDCLLWKETEAQPNPPVIVFCSPSMRQSSRLMHYIQRVRYNFEKIYESAVSFKKEREDFLQFDNYCEIFSVPNNPRTIEGIDASRGVIDEFGNFTGDEDRMIYESLMGSLGAKSGGMVIFGKPRGRRGLFWKLADPYGEYNAHYSVHFLPWTVRAKSDEKYKKTVEDQRKRMSSLAFRENYEAEFVDEQIVMFTYELLDNHTSDHKMWTDDSQLDTKDEVHIGVDFGKKTSQTVVTIVVKESEKVRVKYVKATNMAFEAQIDWISELIKRFKPAKCKIDKTGIGQPLHEKLVRLFSEHIIQGVQFTAQTKEALIYNTLRLFEENRLLIPNHHELKDQLHGIEKEFTDSGSVKYTGKRTETDWKDDHAWSLFLACYEIDNAEWSLKILDARSNSDLTTSETDISKRLEKRDQIRLSHWNPDEEEENDD